MASKEATRLETEEDQNKIDEERKLIIQVNISY